MGYSSLYPIKWDIQLTEIARLNWKQIKDSLPPSKLFTLKYTILT